MPQDRHPDLGDPHYSEMIGLVVAKGEAERKEEEHAKKYPMCTKLTTNREEMARIAEFIVWLQDTKGFDLADALASHHMSLVAHDNETLLHEYFEIDPVKLEEERRTMLEELQGGTDGNERR